MVTEIRQVRDLCHGTPRRREHPGTGHRSWVSVVCRLSNVNTKRRALGAQLAVFRQAAGLNQGQLAKAAFCDRSTVAHIEKGRSRGDERFWTVADECCGANGVLLAGFWAWVAAMQDYEVRAREEQLAQARAKAESLRVAAAPQLLRAADFSGTAGEVAADGKDQLAEQLVKLLCGLVRCNGEETDPSRATPTDALTA